MKLDINTIGYRWKGIYSPSLAYIDQDVVYYNGNPKVWRNGGLQDFAPGQQDALLYGMLLKGAGGVTGTWGQTLTVNGAGGISFLFDQERNGNIATGIITTDNFTGAYVGSSLNWMAATMSEGDVRTWGRNNLGNLGIGRADDISFSQPKRAGFPLGTPRIVKCYANLDQGYFLDAAGGLWTCGQNTQECSGTGAARYAPTKINGNGDLALTAVVTKFFAGHDENGLRTQGCIDSTGKVYMWGNNTLGLMGIGSATAQTYPKVLPISLTNPMKDAYCSGGNQPNSWLIDLNGKLWVAGSGTAGGLGVAQNYHRLFDPWGTNETVRRVRHCETTGLASDGATTDPNYIGTQVITDQGNVYMWGDDTGMVNGSWGNGTVGGVFSQSLLFPVLGTPSGKSVVDCYSIKGGYGRSLALCSDGTVQGTGYTAGNSLGLLNTATSRTTWAQVGAGILENVTRIDMHGTLSTTMAVALRSDGKAVCWGWSNHGSDGAGLYSRASGIYPIDFVHLPNKTIVDFSVSGICVDGDTQMSVTYLCSDGTVWVTGYGLNGMTGNSRDTDTGVPVQIIF